MAIDPQIKAVLQPPRPEDGTYFGLDATIARATLDQMVSDAAEAFPPVTGVDRSDLMVGDVPVRLYRPAAEGLGHALPLLVLAHGGGWVVGGIASHDRLFAQIAQRAGCCVASVAYRLAPEAKFPAALEDVIQVFGRLRTDARRYDIDADRIAIGGDSAGANLAAALSIVSRDADWPSPVFQLLLYPATDLAGSYPSRNEFAAGPMFSGKELEWYIDCYLPDRSFATDLRASPLLAPNLSGLPPAIVVTAGNDMLRDEGLAFAQKLMTAGNRVTHSHHPTMVHGFLMFADISDEAAKALDAVAASIRLAFTRSSDEKQMQGAG